MKKIITLTGAKDCGKHSLAMSLAEYGGVNYIKPYTDKPLNDAEIVTGHHQVSKEDLDIMLEDEVVICCTYLNGYRFAFFESQLKEGYNIMIADDYAVCDIRSNWEDLYTVKIYSKHQKSSDRVGVYLYNHEFDKVFNYDEDDFMELVQEILS